MHCIGRAPTKHPSSRVTLITARYKRYGRFLFAAKPLPTCCGCTHDRATTKLPTSPLRSSRKAAGLEQVTWEKYYLAASCASSTARKISSSWLRASTWRPRSWRPCSRRHRWYNRYVVGNAVCSPAGVFCTIGIQRNTCVIEPCESAHVCAAILFSWL